MQADLPTVLPGHVGAGDLGFFLTELTNVLPTWGVHRYEIRLTNRVHTYPRVGVIRVMRGRDPTHAPKETSVEFVSCKQERSADEPCNTGEDYRCHKV